MEPTKPHTEEHPISGSYSLERFNNLVTQFIGMVANEDEDMADIPEDWEHAGDKGPILDFDQGGYDQFILENPDLYEELPKEEDAEPMEQLECYMNIQDPEPPQEELEKLALGCPTPLSGDATIPDVTYETSDEACLLAFLSITLY